MLLKKMKKESTEMLRMVYVGRKRGSAVLTHPLLAEHLEGEGPF